MKTNKHEDKKRKHTNMKIKNTNMKIKNTNIHEKTYKSKTEKVIGVLLEVKSAWERN